MHVMWFGANSFNVSVVTYVGIIIRCAVMLDEQHILHIKLVAELCVNYSLGMQGGQEL